MGLLDKLPRVARYEIFEGDDGQWYWRLKAANNETVCISEGFSRKWNARRAARKARALSRFALIKYV